MFFTMHWLVLVLVFLCDACYSARVYYTKCNYNGFTCENTADKKTHVTYQCPKNVDDVTIFINQFSAPVSIESLSIKNCQTLTLSTRCSGENRPMKSLTVSDIGNLKFERTNYEASFPPAVNIENISFVETIPTNTFAQISKKTHSPGCYQYSNDFRSLKFKNVTIEILQSNAIVGLTSFENFTMEMVNISRIQAVGVHLNLAKNGSFVVKESKIDVLEPLALQVDGSSLKFYNNKFFDISSNGINGTTEIFHFFSNKVGSLQSHGISLLTQYCYILDNQFDYLKSNAFANISPGLVEVNNVKIGKMKFVYSFSKNVLSFVEAGSLHPDTVSYENVGSDVNFEKNYMYCTCANLGWLVSEVGHGYNTVALEAFYEIVLDKENENNCSYSCDLPVVEMRHMINNGRCSENVTVDYLCLLRDVTSTSTTEVVCTTSAQASSDDTTVSGSEKFVAYKLLTGFVFITVIML